MKTKAANTATAMALGVMARLSLWPRRYGAGVPPGAAGPCGPPPGIATSNAPATAANSIATASGMWPSKPRNDTFTRWPFCRMKISNRMSTSANRIAAAQVRPVRVDRTTCCVAGGGTSSVAGGRGSCERLVAMPIPYPGSRPGMAGPRGAATGPADQGRARPTSSGGAVALPRSRQHRPVLALRSDGECELGEGGRQPTVRCDVDGQVVVAAAHVLHEPVTGRDHCRRAEPLEAAHRPQPGLQPAVVSFDRIVRLPLHNVVPGGCQLVEDPRVGRRPVGGHLDR